MNVKLVKDEVDGYRRYGAGEEDKLSRNGAKGEDLAQRLAVVLSGGDGLNFIKYDGRNGYVLTGLLYALSKVDGLGHFNRDQDDGFFARNTPGRRSEHDIVNPVLFQTSLVVIDEGGEGQNEDSD